MTHQNQTAVSTEQRQQIWQWLQSFNRSNNFQLQEWLNQQYSAEVNWNGCEPLNKIHGRDNLATSVWQPFLQAFPGAKRRDDIFLAGHYEQDTWFAVSGRYLARFEQDWLGIPANGELVQIRYGEFYRLRHGQIVASYHIYDLPFLMQQVGLDMLPPSLGKSMLYLPPETRDGIKLNEGDTQAANTSIELVENMLQGLLSYDGENLSSMSIEQYWAEDFIWYGPAGIGTTQGLADFRTSHQGPFLHAFPDKHLSSHQSYFADSNYATVVGWPSLRATHKGGGWLGLASTDKQVEMRVMDWWCRQEDKLCENWVYMDLPHMLKQLGYDVFARLQQYRDARKQ